ncbi:hypothetical protein HOY80DRAFT_967110 [Tuber brumale]|nr:hypothetical protein HOY80DRAFT_967110 [Tuber brumale]
MQGPSPNFSFFRLFFLFFLNLYSLVIDGHHTSIINPREKTISHLSLREPFARREFPGKHPYDVCTCTRRYYHWARVPSEA